jgi:hypothetical protein
MSTLLHIIIVIIDSKSDPPNPRQPKTYQALGDPYPATSMQVLALLSAWLTKLTLALSLPSPTSGGLLTREALSAIFASETKARFILFMKPMVSVCWKPGKLGGRLSSSRQSYSQQEICVSSSC